MGRRGGHNRHHFRRNNRPPVPPINTDIPPRPRTPEIPYVLPGSYPSGPPTNASTPYPSPPVGTPATPPFVVTHYPPFQDFPGHEGYPGPSTAPNDVNYPSLNAALGITDPGTHRIGPQDVNYPTLNRAWSITDLGTHRTAPSDVNYPSLNPAWGITDPGTHPAWTEQALNMPTPAYIPSPGMHDSMVDMAPPYSNGDMALPYFNELVMPSMDAEGNTLVNGVDGYYDIDLTPTGPPQQHVRARSDPTPDFTGIGSWVLPDLEGRTIDPHDSAADVLPEPMIPPLPRHPITGDCEICRLPLRPRSQPARPARRPSPNTEAGDINAAIQVLAAASREPHPDGHAFQAAIDRLVAAHFRNAGVTPSGLSSPERPSSRDHHVFVVDGSQGTRNPRVPIDTNPGGRPVGPNDLDWCRARCGANFHKRCIDAWLRNAPICPLCRVQWVESV